MCSISHPQESGKCSGVWAVLSLAKKLYGPRSEVLYNDPNTEILAQKFYKFRPIMCSIAIGLRGEAFFCLFFSVTLKRRYGLGFVDLMFSKY